MNLALTTGKAPRVADAIQLEIIRNALIAAAEEMGVAIYRASRSHAIREMLDFSTALFDANGRNVAQAARIPMHLNSMASCLETILTDFIPRDQWQEGDVVITNDPYCGGQHLPDILTFRPVFVANRCIAFSGTICHHSDIGGPAPGGYNARATEIFAEGLRIPPVKIMRQGLLDSTLLAVIAQNVREPTILRADLLAQIAALDIGANHVARLSKRYGTDLLVAAMDQILAQSENAVREAIAQLPEGTYSFEDYVDDDGITESPIRVAVSIKVDGSRMVVDLSGCGPQVPGPVNCTLNIAKSAIYYAVMAGLGGEFQANAGCYRPIEIVTTEGSIVDARPPAPVVSRINVGHRLVNTILGALAGARPESIPAAYYGVSYFYALQTFNDRGETSIYVDSIVGGWGGEPARDGASSFSCGLHNLASIPIEAIEARDPITFTRYGLRPNSGGAGRYRGGLGMIREWRLEADAGSLLASFDRFKFAPYGLHGGKAGARGRLCLTRDGRVEELRSKVVGIQLRKGDVVTIETSGGGGFGSPQDRPRSAVLADVTAGYLTLEQAHLDYGYKD